MGFLESGSGSLSSFVKEVLGLVIQCVGCPLCRHVTESGTSGVKQGRISRRGLGVGEDGIQGFVDQKTSKKGCLL